MNPLLCAACFAGGGALLFRRTAPLGLVIPAPPAIIIFFFHMAITKSYVWGTHNLVRLIALICIPARLLYGLGSSLALRTIAATSSTPGERRRSRQSAVHCERSTNRRFVARGMCGARYRAYLRWRKCPLHCPVAICFAGRRDACMCRGKPRVLCTLPAVERVLRSTRIVFCVSRARPCNSRSLSLR
jgi:hypothetical protein